MGTIREAYDLIKDRERWCVGHTALGEIRLADTMLYRELYPEPTSRYARRWCALGALERAAGGLSECEEAAVKLAAVAESLFPEAKHSHMHSVAFVNDRIGHDAIMQVFEKALVEEEGGL